MRLFHVPQHVRHSLNLRHSFRVHVCTASGDNEKRPGVGTGGPAGHLPRLKVRAVGDGAGIDDGDVRRFSERDKAVSLSFQDIHQCFGFELVDFAAKSGNRHCCHKIKRLS
jgi:hypothetical protein